jgi:hypothetical protein
MGVPTVQVPKNLTQKITKPNTKWKPTVAADGRKVYQRNDLFDPNQVSDWTVNGKKVTGTNIERMAAGRAPLCKDGKSLNLHHIGQGNESNLVEITKVQHTKYSKQLHINPNTISSDIDRNAFKNWVKKYWINRAKEFK